MKKWLLLIGVVFFLAVGTATAVEVSLLTINLKAQQSVTIVCNGDELIVFPVNDNEMQVTCRVWVNEEE